MWKQFVLTGKKALKKEQFHPQNAGNGICETLHFKIFAGENAPGLPLRHSSRPRVGQTNVCPPPKISWPVRLWRVKVQIRNRWWIELYVTNERGIYTKRKKSWKKPLRKQQEQLWKNKTDIIQANLKLVAPATLYNVRSIFFQSCFVSKFNFFKVFCVYNIKLCNSTFTLDFRLLDTLTAGRCVVNYLTP